MPYKVYWSFEASSPKKKKKGDRQPSMHSVLYESVWYIGLIYKKPQINS